MIVPMKKISLIVMGDKKTETLKKLRKLGMVHIEISEGKGEKLVSLKNQISLLENAIFTVGKNKKSVSKEVDTKEALQIAKNAIDLSERKKALVAERALQLTELERLKEWGNIVPSSIKDLSEKGVDVSFYEMPRSEYRKLGDGVKTVTLETKKSSVKFMLFKSGLEGEEEIILNLSDYLLKLPDISTDEAKGRIEALTSEIADIEGKINDLAAYSDSMKNAIKALEKDVEFETFETGMNDADLSNGDGAGVTVAYFKGYVEAENLDKLKKVAEAEAWGLLIEDPTEEDNVPTKLKNNRFVSLIYPLTDFLGTVPGYFEYDISGWFLSFILIFFGIIFGDGGYGLLVCSVAAIPIIKALVTKKKVSPMFLLVGLFGLSTVLWGTLTCTWFGLSPDALPGWLKSLSVPVISNVYADKIWQPFWVSGNVGLTTAQNLQIFCFTLALVQLSVAHIKGMMRNRRSLKLLGDLGSILQLIGIYYLVLSLVVNAEVFSFGLVLAGIPIGTVAIALIGIGFVMSFVFSNYEGSIVKAILASLTNIVSVLLGVVNVFSDIVSYIRLWAVGLAGAAISATVNELAGPLFGNFMFMILAIVLLVFGHGLNMILNVLSVIVHGIRLNTLEFSSHLDMSWSGHKFKPFDE